MPNSWSRDWHIVDTMGGVFFREAGYSIAIINSVALPNVAFKSPPIASPAFSAISLVASDSSAASGMMEMQESTKMMPEC